MKNILSSVLLAFSSLPAMGTTVIVNDAVILDDSGSSDDQVLVLTQSIEATFDGLFAISITPEGENGFRFGSLAIAEEYALFQVAPGLLFTPDYVASTFPLVSNNGSADSGILTLAFGQVAYLAYWDDRDPFESVPTNNDIFGWVEVTPSSVSGLEIVSGVSAIGSGIIVGTSTVVPEPTVGVLLLGVAAMLGRRTRHKIVQNKTQHHKSDRAGELKD